MMFSECDVTLSLSVHPHFVKVKISFVICLIYLGKKWKLLVILI